MTDKALEEAAGEYAERISEGMSGTDAMLCRYSHAETFKDGAAYMLERMRCGTCKHFESFIRSKGEEIYCAKVPGVYPPNDKWGCRDWRAKE